jgi:hypothetical protein
VSPGEHYDVDTVEVSTVVYVSPEEAYEFLVDFPRYAEYSKYLKEITRHGDGTAGTNYDLTFAWWKLSYTARSEVTALDRPTRIDWRLVKDIDARGHWRVEADPDSDSETIPEETSHASRVVLRIEFAPDSADSSAITLPSFVSLDWVISKVKPKIKAEAERIVERIVADLEGQRREVTLKIHEAPDSV